MADFKERLMNMNERAIEEREHPDIEVWRISQKSIIQFFTRFDIELLEWNAKHGTLFPDRERVFGPHWCEDSSNIPNAEEETKKLVQELFDQYDLEVVSVTMNERYDRVTITVRFK